MSTNENTSKYYDSGIKWTLPKSQIFNSEIIERILNCEIRLLNWWLLILNWIYSLLKFLKLSSTGNELVILFPGLLILLSLFPTSTCQRNVLWNDHFTTVLIASNFQHPEVDVKSKPLDEGIHLKTYTTMEHVIEVLLKQWIMANRIQSSCCR